MIQMTAPLFVKFTPENPAPEGFEAKWTYPVFGIDVSCEEDKEITLFLLCNRQNKFVWIDADLLSRSPPQERPNRQDGNGSHKTYPSNRMVHSSGPLSSPAR